MSARGLAGLTGALAACAALVPGLLPVPPAAAGAQVEVEGEVRAAPSGVRFTLPDAPLHDRRGGPRRPGPPNLIVVLADDLGWGDLGVYGQRLIGTPRLDRMAAEGALFTDFYSAAPICPPAREALLTGRHTGHTRVRAFDGVLDGDSAATPRYLPRWLAGAGYVGGMFGKWGMGSYGLEGGGRPRVTAGAPERLGFAEFLGAMTHRDAHTYTLPPYPLQPGDEPIHGRLWTIRNGATREARTGRVPYTQEAFVAATLDFVRRHRDRPFFLYLPWTLPHAELYLPPDDPAWAGYLDAAGESLYPEVPWRGDRTFRRPNPRPRATYAAMVTRLDRDVGRLLDLLDSLGLSEQTVVVVTSDNGPHGAGGIGGPGFFGSAGGLAGMKNTLFEGGIRVPAIVRWPGTVAAGRVEDEPLALWDLLPTFLEIAGVARPAGIDGLSFAPLLHGVEQPGHAASSPLYWESFADFRGQAARLGRYKALRGRLATPDDRVRLFDLEADPGETTDLMSDPARRSELCPVYLALVRILNAARTDPGGRLSFPPLREECPGGS